MKILICSDGPRQAEKAIRFIANTAADCAAEVTLLGVIEHPSDEPALLGALRKQASILRDKQVSVEVVTRSGQPLEEIQKRNAATPFDLVVFGAEHKNGGRFAMSAKVYHLIKSIAAPVLVLIGERTELRRILICSGGQAYIDNAVKLTGQLACHLHLAVAILHVLAQPPAMFAGLLASEQNVEELLGSSTALGRNLRSEKEALAAFGITPEFKLRHGLVVPEILDELKQGDYDLVVTGSALSAGAMRTYIMGDVTSEIVNRAECAVLVVRSDGAARRGFFQSIVRLFSKPQDSGQG